MGGRSDFWLKKVASPYLMAMLLLLYVVAIGVATFVERYEGVDVARRSIYYGWWFILLQGLFIVNFVAMSVRRRLFAARRWGVLLLHYGLVVVLVGAMVTHVFGREGIVHIRQGESTSVITDNKGVEVGQLPFRVELHRFVVERYGGSASPSSYVSEVAIEGRSYSISLNNPLRYDGWRIYQSSFDADERGSYLSASYDTAGTVISYVGYVMLVLGMAVALMGRGSRFGQLLSRLGVVAVLSMTVACGDAPVSAEQRVVDEFERLVVESPTGRMQSVGSYADDLVRKISRKNSVDGIGASQVLLSMLTDPQTWSMRPLIADTAGHRVAFISAIDTQGAYRYGERVEQIAHKSPTQRNKADKEMVRFDERINIVDNLFTGRMFAIFPRENSSKWYSPGERELLATDFAQMPKDSLLVNKIWGWFATSYNDGNYDKAAEILGMISTYQRAKSEDAAQLNTRVEAELLYVRLTPFRWSGYLLLTMGLLLSGVVVAQMVGTAKWLGVARWGLIAGAIGVWLFATFGIALRWYISGRAPWASSYETMVFVGWSAMLAGLFFVRRSAITFALSVFLSGVLLFVSNLSWMDPQITPLMPVLDSYWLILHVAVITSSYSFFGVGFLLGVTMLLFMVIWPDRLKSRIDELAAINEMALTVGLVLLVAGTFLGAVWANESWGRYWGWDPKESWALITIMVYAFVVHMRFVEFFRSEYALAVGSIVGLGAVLMTFFGVNYFLSGMHSYGVDSAPPALWIIFAIYVGVVVLAVGARFGVRAPRRR